MPTQHARTAILVVAASTMTAALLTACGQTSDESPNAGAASLSAGVAAETATDTGVSTAPSTTAGLGFGTYGDIELGMTTSEVIAKGFTLGKNIQADGCDGYELSHDPNGKQIGLYFRPADGTLSKIRVDGGTQALPQQEPTISDVRSAYSDATVSELPPRGPQGPRIAVQDKSGGAFIVYTVIGNTATRPTTVGSTAPGCPAYTS